MKFIRRLNGEGRALRSTTSGPRACRGAARPRPGGSPALQLVLCLLSSVLCSLVRAADPVELGPDLGYVRLHSLVRDREAITAALLKPRAVVLDLRYPLDERDAAETLRQELTRLPGKTRLYVLVSPATPVPVVGVIAATPVSGLVTLGVKGSRPEPQVVVEQTAEADRAAYAALDSGTPLARLVSGKIEKERFDEAALVKEFRNGNHDARPPEAGLAPGKEIAAPPIDRVLQRAIHLHRALQALKR